MASNPDTGKIRAELKDLIGETEQLYSIILEKFPEMEKSIEMASEETKILIEYFIRTKQAGEENNREFLLREILLDIRSKIELVDEALLEKKEIDNLLQSFMVENDKNEASVHQLMETVQRMDRSLKEISMVALNAIIFSKRLGTEGASFSVVAQNIKELSLQLSKNNERVQQLINFLQKWIQNFQDNIKDLLSNREKITREHGARVKGHFERAIEGLGEIGNLLYDLLKNVDEILRPGREVMVLIQNQDIIRQGLENLSHVLQAVDETPSGRENDKEKDLDNVTFRYNALQLAQKLMCNLNEQLGDSVFSINEKLKTLSDELDELAEDAYYLMAFFSGQDFEEGSVDKNFQLIGSFTEDFVKAVRKLSDRCTQLTEDRQKFVHRLEETGEHIDQIKKRIENLEKMRLFSAIELARIDVKEHSFSESIEETSEQVVKVVKDNRNYYQKLKGFLEERLEKLDSTMTEAKKTADESLKVISRSAEELHTTNDIVNQAIYSLYHELQKLSREIKSLNDKFAVAEQLKKDSKQIEEQIGSSLNSVEKEKEELFSFYQVTEWQERNERLVELVNKFTTYAEKFTAKELFQDIELGEKDDSEGDLTLF